MKISNTIVLTLLMVFSIFIVGCNVQLPSPGTGNVNQASFNLTGSQDLKKFSNIDELRNFLAMQEQSPQQAGFGGGTLRSDVLMGAATPSVSTGALENSKASATDYSQTNVQVQGVDEADFVKNDNRYIYMIAGNNLVIIDAIDGKNSTILSKTQIVNNGTDYYNSPTIQNIFLNGDTIVVFANVYEKSLYFNNYDITPIDTYKQNTEVYTYDVSDRTNPILKDSYKISGTYSDSRMIKSIVYVITQEGIDNVRYYDGPLVSHGASLVRPDIYYFDNPEQNYQMNTITSINLDNQNIVDSKSFMLGYGTTVMVSENSIYIAYQPQRYWCFGWRCVQQDNDNKNRFVGVVVPLLQGDLKAKVNNILAQGLSDDEEWQQISTELGKFYTAMSTDENLQKQYEPMFTSIQTALDEYDAKKALDYDKTIIHKINIDNGQITYSGKGEVDGTLLNQFSMDEYNGNLRVATSVNLWLNNGRKAYNNVYVLDSSMDIIGSLENLAENETIYSTRFMNDKLYMVTYRQIDPFFVIDLSTPSNPKVLGYLKIPGYSSYLHPISDTLIIGVGKATGTDQWGGTVMKGIKISLFDVSDFNNPKEIDKYEIGDTGSDSPILYDHKAFLYSPTKNLLVVPVMEVTQHNGGNGYSYNSDIWNGAYAFNVSSTGFALLGKIEHGSSSNNYYYWNNDAAVRRSLYLDNNLYTISTKYVIASDLNNNLAELNTITLPETPQPVVYPVMMGAAGSVAVK